MPVIGSLMLDIKVDTAYIREGLDRAYRQVQSFGQRVNKVFSAFGSLALGYGLYSGMKKIIELTDTQQKSYEQLRAALDSTGHAAGLTFESLKAISSEMQRTTTLGDEAVQQAEAILLTFGKVTKDVFADAMMAAANMAARMGTDISTTIVQVGKALQDPIQGTNTLRRVGILLSDSQKEQIKNFVELNRMVDAQKIILGELEKKFGGTAQAMRGTLGGAIKSFMNLLGDTFEMSSDATQPLVNAIEYVNENFRYLVTTIKAVTGLILLSLIPVLTKLVKQIYAVGIAIMSFTLKNPFMALITVVTIAISELIMFRDSLVSLGGVSAKVKDWLSAAFQVVKPILEEIWSSIVHFANMWIELFKSLGGIFVQLFKSIGSFFKSIFDMIVALMSPLFNNVLIPMFQGLGNIIASVCKSIFGSFDETFLSITNIVKWSINGIVGLFVVLPKTVSVALGSIYEHFKDLFSSLANLGKAFWQGLKNLFTAGDFSFSVFTDALRRDFLEPSVDIAKQVGDAIKESFTTDYLGISSEYFEPSIIEFKSAMSDMGDAFNATVDLMGKDWTSVWEQIKKDASDATLFDEMKKQASSVGDMVYEGLIPEEDELEELDKWKGKYDELVKSIRFQIESQKELIDVFNQMPEVINEVRASLKAKEEVMKLGIDNAEIQAEKIVELTELYRELYTVEQRMADLSTARDLTYKHDPILKYNEAMKDMIRLNEQGLISTAVLANEQAELWEQMVDTYTEMMMKTKEWTAGAIVALHDYVKEASNAAQNFYNVFSNAFRKLEDEFVSLFTQLKFDFKSLMQSIQADITRAFVRQEITAPLAASLGISGLGGPSMLFSNPPAGAGVITGGGILGNVFSGGGGGGGGGLFGGIGNLLSGIGGLVSGLFGLFGGFFAEGGDVSPGKMYVVGEKGPEIFKPKQSGQIIPNDQLPNLKSIVTQVNQSNRLNTNIINQNNRFDPIMRIIDWIMNVFSNVFSKATNISKTNVVNRNDRFNSKNQIPNSMDWITNVFSKIANISKTNIVNQNDVNQNDVNQNVVNQNDRSNFINQMYDSMNWITSNIFRHDSFRNIDQNLSYVSSGIAGVRAEGGIVSSGLNYLVGEKGPEVFIPYVKGFTETQHSDKKKTSLFNNIEININVPMDREQARYSASQIAHELLSLSMEGRRNQ